jgi:hypothetical protein
LFEGKNEEELNPKKLMEEEKKNLGVSLIKREMRVR